MIVQASEFEVGEDTRRMLEGLHDCRDCRELCLEALSGSLDVGGRYARGDHIRLLLDCADACGLVVSFLLRDSRCIGPVAEACRVVAGRCAASCGEFVADALLARCAEACGLAANSCRLLAAIRCEPCYDNSVEQTFPASDPINSIATV